MKALRQTIISAIFYLTLITTFMSFSNIITYIIQHKKDVYNQLGSVILATNYSAFMIANSIVPSLSFKYVTMMKLAALTYTFNYVTEAFELDGAMGVLFSVVGAGVGGVGASFLWIAYGGYMKAIVRKHQQQQMQEKYFGILNGITFSSLLLGPIITTFALGLFSTTIYFIILIALGLLSFLVCHFLIKQPEQQFKEQSQNKSSDTLLSKIKDNLMFYCRMKQILFVIIIDGFSLSFISNFSVILLPFDTSALLVGIFLIFTGIGATIGGLLSGYISNALSLKIAGFIALISFCLTIATTEIQIYNKSLIFGFCVSLLWGLTVHFIEGWMFIVCSKIYNGKLSSFANVKQLHSVTFCLYQISFALLKDNFNAEYLFLLLVFLVPFAFIAINRLPDNHVNFKGSTLSQDSQ